jgi:transposase
MLGKRSAQRGLFEADTQYRDFIDANSFYAFLARHRGELFRDELFAGLYAPKLGRPSVPPSLLATALVLQTYDNVSDEEARDRAAYDLRWKVALGIEIDARPFAKSTLQEFRAQLVIHEQPQALFHQSLELAKRQGYFKGKRKLKVALDTTNILGRGAVKDTYNLLADGIVLVLRVLARQAGEELEAFAESVGCGRYVLGSSLKGQAEIDWSEPRERRRFLQEVVADADRVLERVRQARGHQVAGSPADAELVEAAGLLVRVLAQDIERTDDGPAVKEGVAKDRLSSVHDPDMRHGRKSAAKRFDGHKADVAVDTDSQLITAVGVLAGNSGDAEQALERIRETEAITGCVVAETLGDCAYGDGGTRQRFHDAERRLVAKVPTMTNQGAYPKTAFVLNLEAGTCTCPAGHTTEDFRPAKAGGGGFRFAAAACSRCPLRAQCVRGPGGRSVSVHPQETLLQQARALQASPAFRDCRGRRQAVEHRIARLVQLGIRQARYFGRAKTLFQLAMAAAVANLTLVMTRAAPDASSALLAATLFAFCLLLVSPPSPPSACRPRSRAFALGADAWRAVLPAILPCYPDDTNKRLLRPDF